MTQSAPKFFLFIGGAATDSAVSRLKASGIFYRQKMLESKPENWEKIVRILGGPDLAGVICKITGWNYRLIVAPEYADVGQRLFAALAKTRHVAFVHENVLAGDLSGGDSQGVDDEVEGDYWPDYLRQSEPTDEDRQKVNYLTETYQVNILPYRTNAELSVMAAAFIDDNERNLLFRLYVPSGRLYAAEADKLLSLFQDWLAQVGRFGVRQDGYSTAAGKVYEFFGDASLETIGLVRKFEDFSDFLEQCVQSPELAEAELARLGLDRREVAPLVARFSREARRLHIDLRQEREVRLLAIRHRLEAEILDVVEGGESWRRVDHLLQVIVPPVASFSPQQLLSGGAALPAQGVTLNVNQNIVNAVGSEVIQNIQGTVNLGSEAKTILKLIEAYGGHDRAHLESAVHEFEDQDARATERLGAKQRLRGFLVKLGGHVESATLAALQKYLEAKMGISG